MKITRLHLRDYRAMRSLDLPQDGLGWQGVFPDVVLVGGGNGSGKTTLLHWIVTGLRALEEGVQTDLPSEGVLTVDVNGRDFEYRAGPIDFVERSGGGAYRAWSSPGGGGKAPSFPRFAPDTPRVLLVPSPRDLRIPSTAQKLFGHQKRSAEFVHIWSAPRDWQGSAEAQLYEARWLDLNAKDEGHPERATEFARYADAFTSLIPGRTLVWEGGELVVAVAGSDVRHDLGALSSGEKQIFLLLADLLLYWTPDSIVLIDEPELHLHRSLQIRFFEALKRWRAEKGGQLWLATQSTELFGAADNGTKVLLGGGSL